jgi:hypothetical protein
MLDGVNDQPEHARALDRFGAVAAYPQQAHPRQVQFDSVQPVPRVWFRPDPTRPRSMPLQTF